MYLCCLSLYLSFSAWLMWICSAAGNAVTERNVYSNATERETDIEGANYYALRSKHNNQAQQNNSNKKHMCIIMHTHICVVILILLSCWRKVSLTSSSPPPSHITSWCGLVVLDIEGCFMIYVFLIGILFKLCDFFQVLIYFLAVGNWRLRRHLRSLQ